MSKCRDKRRARNDSFYQREIAVMLTRCRGKIEHDACTAAMKGKGPSGKAMYEAGHAAILKVRAKAERDAAAKREARKAQEV